MNTLWKQFIYGKQVQSVDGPIVPGKDHECTGQTQGIPRALQRHMTPSIVGPGTSDLTKWNDYVWNDPGGLAIQPVVVEGQAWMVAGRVRGRSERGEDKQGRYYTQTHYVTIPAKDYSPLSVLGLHEELKAIAMVDKDMDMPELAIPLRDRPLQDQWLDMIAPLLRITLSGLPFAIWAPKLELQDLVALFQLVHCALPKALNWKMSIRIGSYQMSEGEVVLNSGQDILGGPRMIGFRFDDLSRNEKKINDIQDAEKHLFDPKKLLGDRYVDYLCTHMQSCRTLVQLQDKIAEHFPHLTSWDYFPVDMSFSEAGVQFIRTIFEKDGLEKIEQALRGDAEYPPLAFFHVYRGKVLELVAAQAFGSAHVFVSKTIPKWADAWKEVRTQNTDVASLYPLFFTDEPWSAQTVLLLQKDIPQIFQPWVRVSIQKEALRVRESATSFSCWIGILERLDQLSPWVQEEIHKHEMFLFWAALQYKRNGDERLLVPFQNKPLYSWYARVMQGKIGKEIQLSKWFSACPADSRGLATQEWFVREALKRSPITGLKLLSHASPSLSIHSRFDFPQVFSMSDGVNVATSFLSTLKRTEVAPLELVRIALVFRASLSEPLQETLFSYVQSSLSPWLGLALFGTQTSAAGKYDEDARLVFIHEYQNSPQTSSDLVEQLHGLVVPSSKSSACAALYDLFYKNQLPARCSYSKIAKALMQGQAPSKVRSISFKEVRLDVLSWFLSEWNLPAETGHIQSLSILFAIMRSGGEEYSLSWHQILDILSRPEWQKRFAKLAKKSGWKAQEGWRIVFQWNQTPTKLITEWSRSESKALSELSEQQKLICVSSGMIVDAAWERINAEDYQALDDSALAIALWGTLHSKDEFLQKLTLLEALVRLKAENKERFVDLRKMYTAKKNFFASVWSSMQKMTRSFSEAIPEGVNLDKAVTSVLEGYDAKKSKLVFSSFAPKKEKPTSTKTRKKKK